MFLKLASVEICSLMLLLIPCLEIESNVRVQIIALVGVISPAAIPVNVGTPTLGAVRAGVAIDPLVKQLNNTGNNSFIISLTDKD